MRALALLAAMLVATTARAAPTPEGPAINLHVNRVALEAAGPKSAIIEATVPLKAGTYTVLRDGEPVLNAPLTALPAFDEWGVGKHYYLADFSNLSTPGRYMVRAQDGLLTAASGNIDVGPDQLFRTTAPALVHYFHESRWLDAGDHHRRVFGTDRFVDVWGGWKDAGGDNGKYLSHLSYANFFNPQQAGLTAWALARAYDAAPTRFRAAGLDRAIVDEAFWGADFLHRMLSPEGYFYMTVFEGWNRPGAERMVTGYVGERGVYTEHYQAAMREGGGVSIAALARAARLARQSGRHGAFDGAAYLADAERAWAHLALHNLEYVDDGRENIIDDYCALLAATELVRATGKPAYLAAADARARALAARLTPQGWWRSDDKDRPFYHGADAGDAGGRARRIPVRRQGRRARHHRARYDRSRARRAGYARHCSDEPVRLPAPAVPHRCRRRARSVAGRLLHAARERDRLLVAGRERATVLARHRRAARRARDRRDGRGFRGIAASRGRSAAPARLDARAQSLFHLDALRLWPA